MSKKPTAKTPTGREFIRYCEQLAGIDLEIRDLLQQSAAVATVVAAQGRVMTDDELGKIQSHLKQVGILEGLRVEVEAAISTVARIAALTEGVAETEAEIRKTRKRVKRYVAEKAGA